MIIQKYISVIKLKKQTVTGAMGLLQIETIYLYVNMDAMVQILKSLYTKKDKPRKGFSSFFLIKQNVSDADLERV